MGKDIKVAGGSKGKRGGGRRKKGRGRKGKSVEAPRRSTKRAGATRSSRKKKDVEPVPIYSIKKEILSGDENELELDPEVEAQITFGSRRRLKRPVETEIIVPPEETEEQATATSSGGKRRRKRRKLKEGSPDPEPDPLESEPKPSTSAAALLVNSAHLQQEIVDDDDSNRELTEEEKRLQELRIEEEINKLTDIKEIVLGEGDCIRGVDDTDDLDGDDVNGSRQRNAGDSDDDYDFFDEETGEMRTGTSSDLRCPPPAPPKRRGPKTKARDLQDEEAVKERMQLQQEMCTLIKKSLNTDSLSHFHREAVVEPLVAIEAIEGVESEDEAGPLVVGDSQEQAVALINSSKNYDTHVIYQNLQRALTIQDTWLQKKMTAYASCPQGFAEDLVTYNLMKSSLAYQLYVEHLSWLAVKSVETIPTPFSRDGLIAWLPDFRRKFYRRFPQLVEDAMPNARSDLDTMLKIAFERAVMQLQKIQIALMTVHDALLKMHKVVKIANAEKKKIHAAFEEVYDDLALRSLKFDETSAWGLRHIRNALEPPYFKTDDGIMAAPLFPDAETRVLNYPKLYFQRDKQKWTTKDLSQLKDCIKEVLQVKRFNVIRDRYEVLMVDCINQYEQEMEREGRLDAPPLEPLRRKRGRPKKSELELTTKYGVIHPVIAILPNGIVIRSEVTPRLLSEWRTTEEKKVRGKTYEELIYMENERVDWIAVSNKLVVKSRKNRSPKDCELAWRHEVHPKVFNKRWTADESYALKRIYDAAVALHGKDGIDWTAIANQLNEQSVLTAVRHGAGRTTYQCFFRVRNRLEPPKKLEWNDELDKLLLEKMNEHPGNWRLITAGINDPVATKRQVIERYKKTINPMLRNGAFTRVEDCLLILTIERLKPFLAREGHFGCLLAYLPWRCETTWRDRANNLFSDWIVPWTIEEDKLLLMYARTMNRNWQKISEQFVSFKNRKGCLTRYKILKKRLKEPKFNGSLEAYHEAYAMTRYNIFQYKHLKVILKLLLRVQKVTLPDEHQTFVGLIRDQSPSEARLQHMLLTYDRDILSSAIASLARYVQTRDRYWATWMETHGERRKTFDRRTFHPENPQSVASALHIRGLQLKKKNEFQNLSDFESEIYKFFARFCRTKEVDKQAERRYIPEAKTLVEWSAVSRLIAPPPPEILNKKEKGARNKWESLNADFPFKNGVPIDISGKRVQQTGRGRSAKALVKSSKHRLTKLKKKKQSPIMPRQKRSYVRRKNISDKKRSAIKKQVKESANAATDEEGYLLIPSALKKPRKKANPVVRKRKIKKEKEDDFEEAMEKETDPEFKVELPSSSGTGRSREMYRRSCTKKPDLDTVYDFSDGDSDS